MGRMEDGGSFIRIRILLLRVTGAMARRCDVMMMMII
jgi:hypothetical protein